MEAPQGGRLSRRRQARAWMKLKKVTQLGWGGGRAENPVRPTSREGGPTTSQCSGSSRAAFTEARGEVAVGVFQRDTSEFTGRVQAIATNPNARVSDGRRRPPR